VNWGHPRPPHNCRWHTCNGSDYDDREGEEDTQGGGKETGKGMGI
jgi:hypothetical protein